VLSDVLAGKRGDRSGDGSKVLAETTVSGGQAHKLTNLFYIFWNRPLCDGSDLFQVGSYVLPVDDVSEVFELVHTEPAFVRIEAQF